MDRNAVIAKPLCQILVALRKESVDRNISSLIPSPTNFPSLSARRAWIEINVMFSVFASPFVALRKESVDRNVLD